MIQKNILLKDYSNYKIGGPAAFFLEVSSTDDLKSGLKEWEEISKNFEEKNKRIFILGKGTNLLISEDGFNGLVIHNCILGIEKNNSGVKVGAGVLFSDLLNYCVNNSLSGLEWAGGLPGTVGGAVRGNAGAFKGETKDNIVGVSSLNLNTLEEKSRQINGCEFDYRTSVFKTKATNEIILNVIFRLVSGNEDQIKNSIQEKINYRNEKHPMDKPSIGSTFKNVKVKDLENSSKEELTQYIKDDPFPVIPVAKILYLCGLKGKREGDAQISEKHPNFIVNLGNAKFEDVKKLIEFEKQSVKDKFGITLEEEIIYLD